MQKLEEPNPTLTDAEFRLRQPIIRMRGLAQEIDSIRTTWLSTDEKVSNWKGLGPGTGGFEKLSEYEREPLISCVDYFGIHLLRTLPYLSEDLRRDIVSLQELFRQSSTPTVPWSDDLDRQAHLIEMLLLSQARELENTTPVDQVNGSTLHASTQGRAKMQEQRPRSSGDSKPRSKFECNRQRFAYLCREMIERISEISDDSLVDDIGPLVRESELLAKSLNFPAPPIKYCERSQPHYRYVRVLIWNDPHCTEGGEIWLSAPSKKTGLDAVANRSKAEDRALLVPVLERWIRAIDGAVEPLDNATINKGTVDKQHIKIKRPSDEAMQAWRLRDLKGLKTQREVADEMTKQLGYEVKQPAVSNWLKDAREYIEACGIFPELPMIRQTPVSVDPAIIEMGERQDGLTKHQRKQPSDAD